MLCPYCQNDVSLEAQICPQSGHPFLGSSSPKSRAALSVLCFFIGYLGIHRFYAGRIKSGLLQLCLTGLGFLSYLMIFIFAAGGALFGSGLGPEGMLGGLLAGGIVGTLVMLVIPVWIGLWIILDFIIGICGKFKDGNGRLIDRW
jgi:hypothetical protein